MMDVKKLVIGFLVLAVATSASALLISTVGSGLASGNATANGATGTAIVAGAAANTGAQQQQPGNAFFPQAPAAVVTDDTAAASTSDAIMGDPNNLTNILTNAYMNNLVLANPNGPALDASGNPSLAQPDNSGVIAQFMSSSTALANIETPNWNSEADQIPVTVIATSSPDATTNYSDAIQNIFDQNFVQTNLQAMLANNADPSAAGYVQPKIQTALRDIAGLQTPLALKSFQKSLITLLVYEKNMLSLAGGIGSSTDPLKAALVLENETPKYNAAITDFQAQLQKASAATGFAPFALSQTKDPTPAANGVVAFINTALGIKTAHALFGLGDITFDPSVFAQMLISYANNIALQILKNLVMSLMQKTVLKWVQGNGVPRFIQGWGTTLVNAYTQTAINALNSQMMCVNSAPYAAQLRLTLGATYKPGNNVCAVQFQSQLANNLTNFYNHFENGGWVTYGATMQPDNNYYGTAFFTAQAVGNTAYNAQQAAQAKSISNQGWNGGQVCDDGSNPTTGTHFVCPDGSKPSNAGLCFIVGQQPFPAAVSPNNGVCADGTEPQVTQPGQVTGQVFNSAVDSSGKLTAAANDIAGLLDSFLSSLLNSLAQDAITTTGGFINNIGAAQVSPSTGTQGGQVPISCSPTQQTANQDMVTFIGAGGQTLSVTNGVSNTSVPTYIWSVPGGTPATGPGGQFTTTFGSGGTYVATVTDTNPADGGVSAQCNVTVP